MSTLPPTAHPTRHAVRDTDAGYLGGVAAGLASHLGLPVFALRVFFAVTTAFGGLGLMLYAAWWLVLPAVDRRAEQAPGLAAAERSGRRAPRVRRLVDAGPTLALAAVGVGLLVLLQLVFGGGTVFWVLALGVAGIGLIWRQADEAQRERWRYAGGRVDPLRVLIGDGSWADWTRLLSGAFLILAALVLFALRSGELSVARDVLMATLFAVIGLALTAGPWVLRLATDLSTERAERIRSEERADVAAHLHDSVLQTLALIQKSAGDPAQVARLARAQERDLRSWLFADTAPSGALSAALATIATEVEAAHDCRVEVVTVGELVLDERTAPVVHATREAVVNAARHAGTGRVDVYAEVSPGAVAVFVKDRGAGFDPATVPADRQGVRGSILDRMQRHGGTAEVRSAPGEGTEVVLRMELEEPR